MTDLSNLTDTTPVTPVSLVNENGSYKIVRGAGGTSITHDESSNTVATATKAAESDKCFKILGYAGGSLDKDFTVQVMIGTTPIWTVHGKAGTTKDFMFGENGPEAAINTAISVVTTPASSGQCTANIIYRQC